MMDTCSDHGDNQFFDALEEIAMSSDSCSDCTDNLASNSGLFNRNSVCSGAQFDFWIQNPKSVEARRSKFFDWLGLDVNKISHDSADSSDLDREVDGIISSDYEFSSSRSFMSCSSGDHSNFSGNLWSNENSICCVGNSNEGMEDTVMGDHNRKSGGSDISVMVEPPECSSSSSFSGGDFSPGKNTAVKSLAGPRKRVKKWWLSRLRGFTCIMEREEESISEEESINCRSSSGSRIRRVKVHLSRKQSKELSALYLGQNIQAHKGAILTMKFSPNGRFLASAGEDRIVRVWRVVEDDRSNVHHILDMDPSCVYFIMNHLSELKPLGPEKEKKGKSRRTSDSACVILPPKVFRILEKPLHVFHGHTGEILDISWSNNNCLLSSSVDKTVRLWQIGLNHCLKVFPHNNYVTCVQFNPVDDNYFISGSIDGKVRIWDISHGKVVSWTEIKDIVTAVCYCPDGQGGIIGSITGSCRFYSISSDNLLQLDGQIFLHNKKKSSGKRITGFQFFPRDPSKVMVSCADSQVRILQGANLIGKYKRHRSSGTYCSAFFTSDGKHIVSASEDSNVYIWKCVDQDNDNPSHIKKVKSSERFLSYASVALPWPGWQNQTSRKNAWQNGAFGGAQPFFSPARFSCGQELLSESYYSKGSALWPEEKLLAPRSLGAIPKSDLKFLRTCQSRLDSHTWGLIIVTAGWDGRIRSFHNYGLPVPPS